MKKPNKPFTEQYPYLAYWIEDWGEMETTNGDWNRPRIRLIDEGGTWYEDYTSTSHEEALQKAEEYLRSDEGRRYDKETIDALEEEYQNQQNQ
jgi:hypothetical protein